ncbi:MAG TPA: hypothetical protein VM012_05665 [Flavitalea sp.]|nr:hypothetical protein [Flavitalea sp.]
MNLIVYSPPLLYFYGRIQLKPHLKNFILYFFLMLLIGLAGSGSTYAQRYDWRDKIDLIVRHADSIFNKSQKTFYSLRYLKNNDAVKETWHYTMRDGKIVIFQLRYLIDQIEYNEVYYLNKGDLVCMEQYESPVQLSDEEIRHAEVFYFVGSEMRQFVTYGGRPQKNYSNFDTGNQCLDKFRRRYDELLRNMKHTPNMGEE